MILNSAGSETKFAGNGGKLRGRVVQRKGQKEQVLERVYPLVKELKGDDESNEEWDRLKWGSLHGLAKDKRYGMKQRTMGKPICMWSSS